MMNKRRRSSKLKSECFFCNIQSSDQILESTSVTSNKFKQILVTQNTQNMVKSFDDIAPFGYGIVETNY